MARPARSELEKRQGGMRAAALLHVLAARMGAKNPHQFAACFDDNVGTLYPPENPRSSECRRFRGNSGAVGRVVVGGAEMR